MPSANDGVYWSHYYPHLNGGSVTGPGFDNQQNRLYRMLHMKLTEIAMNRFEWTGFPEEVQLDNLRWVEKCLFETALAVFYEDTEWDRHFVMRAAPGGVWNFVGNPTKFLAYGNTYYNKWLDADECVAIWANYMRYPDYEIVNLYAEVLSELDMTIRVNARNARRTKVLRVSEKSKLTLDNIQRQIDAGNSFIKVLPELPAMNDLMEAIDLGIDPSTIMELSMLRSRIWNECMTLLGINNNAGADKKERLVADEVSGNDDQVSAIRATNLQSRLQACAQIKKQFGFDVTVQYVTDMASEDTESDLAARDDTKKGKVDA